MTDRAEIYQLREAEYNRCMKLISAAALVVALCQTAFAQSPGTTSYGNFSGHYQSPNWGQTGITVWGTYSGAVGHNWSYNHQLTPGVPLGTVLANPNQLNSSFANPRTGANLFQPQDTRLRGRDRP
jgi:hypothetical protein